MGADWMHWSFVAFFVLLFIIGCLAVREERKQEKRHACDGRARKGGSGRE